MESNATSVKKMSEVLEAIKLEPKQKKAIFDLIDLKVSIEKNEILLEVKFYKENLESKFTNLEKSYQLRDKIFYFLFGFLITIISMFKLLSLIK